MSFAEIDGARLYYQVEGRADGVPVLFCNSLGTDLSAWDSQAAALSPDFKVIRYDNRGHGKSTETPGPYTVELLAKDALALLDKLGVAKVHVVGLSLGGMMAMWLGAHAPQRVGKLVIANAAAKLGPADIWNNRIAVVRKGGMAAVADAVMERWLSPGFRQSHPAETAAAKRMLLATPAEGYCASCAAVRDMDHRPELAMIKAKTLVIAGTFDPATNPVTCRIVADGIAGSQWVELPAAHQSNLETAEEFNRAIHTFLLG